jgi:hypothetical protein
MRAAARRLACSTQKPQRGEKGRKCRVVSWWAGWTPTIDLVASISEANHKAAARTDSCAGTPCAALNAAHFGPAMYFVPRLTVPLSKSPIFPRCPMLTELGGRCMFLRVCDGLRPQTVRTSRSTKVLNRPSRGWSLVATALIHRSRRRCCGNFPVPPLVTTAETRCSSTRPPRRFAGRSRAASGNSESNL